MQRAGAGIPKIMAELLRRAPADQAAILGWSLVCGPGVANRTKAVDFIDGILRVEVPDRAWLAQLAELVPRYLAALNGLIEQRVKRITFVLPNEVLQKQNNKE